MAEQGTASIATLVRSVIDDSRELVREEIALAKAELREEVSIARNVGIGFAAAAVLAVIGVVILCVALGGALADVLDAPAWIGHGLVALLLGGGAFVLFRVASTRLATLRALPKTRESVRENMAWIRSKSNSR